MTEISDLLDALYATVQDATRWPEVLERIGTADQLLRDGSILYQYGKKAVRKGFRRQ